MSTIVNLKIDELTPYQNNPRVNDQAVAGVVASIRKFGFIGAVIVNRDKVIINGHTRVKAMKELGADTIPAIVVDNLTPEQENALRIADNKTGEVAEWNEELLKAELQALQEAGFDMGSLGFDESELEELLGGTSDEVGQTDPDEAPEVPETAESKSGEVYVLGPHLLLCGDSTKAADVASVAADGTVDCWLTDPPYNVNYGAQEKKYLAENPEAKRLKNDRTIMNDNMGDAKFREFLKGAFANAHAAMKPGATGYIFHADSEGYNFRGACIDAAFKIAQCLIWKKNSLVLGFADYQWIHEPCLLVRKPGASHHWYGDRSQTTVMEYDKPKKNDMHPTMKPTEMLVYLLKNSTKRGDVVLDTFGGSGSTLIACQQTGRVCRCVELDPKYCDVIRRRWAEHVHGEGCDWKALTPARGECADAGGQGQAPCGGSSDGAAETHSPTDAQLP